MKRCHIFLGRFHSSACPASVFLSLLQTGKAPGGGHPRLPRGPTPTSPVLGCPILPVRLTALDQGPPVRQYRNTSRYWCFTTARVIPILYLKKLRLWAVYPRQCGLDLGYKAWWPEAKLLLLFMFSSSRLWTRGGPGGGELCRALPHCCLGGTRGWRS